MAPPGIGLLAMAVSDARIQLSGWGTDRLRFRAALFIQPWTTAFLLLVSGAVVEGRLKAQGYTQCPNHAPGLRWRWDEWVRNGAACEHNAPDPGAGGRTPL